MLGIILINYNSEKETVAYIKQELSKLSYKNVIVVVNNSFSEPSHQLLTRGIEKETNRILGQDIFLITKHENLGYARANNFGAQFLDERFDINYFLFSNTDINLKDHDVVEVLIQKLNALPRKFAAIGPRVIGLDGIDQSPKNEISFWRYFGWHLMPFLRGKITLLKKKNELYMKESLSERECYQVSGCFLLIKKQDFVNAGMFDERTFLYGEEKILTERLLSIGKKMYFYPKANIIHYESTIIRKNKNSKEIRKMLHDNNCYYYKTYKNIASPLVYVLKCLQE